MRRKLMLLLLLFVLLASAQASVQGNLNLTKTSYKPSEKIEGFLDISLTEEPAEKIFFSRKGGGESYAIIEEMLLLDFLNLSKISEKEVFCSPQDCKSFYSEREGDKSKVMKDGTFGFKIQTTTGKTNVTDLSFSITGTETAETEMPPAEIDLLDDGSIDWRFAEASDNYNNFIYSECYNETKASNWVITTTAYCQKFLLPVSSKFILGAMVGQDATMTKDSSLRMYIYDKDKANNERGYCSKFIDPTTEWNFLNCTVENFTTTKQKEYYVCIEDTGGNFSEFQIRAESSSPCGYTYSPWQIVGDFAIKVAAAKIAPFNKKVIFNALEFKRLSENRKVSLQKYLQDYIEDKYKRNCTAGCLLPMRIKSSKDIIISEIALKYTFDGATPTEDSIYWFDVMPAKINMTKKKISVNVLDMNAPSVFGNYMLKANIGDWFDEAGFSVLAIPEVKALTPRTVALNTETTFRILLSLAEEVPIVNYTWNFGDGTIKTSKTENITHSYSRLGNYNISITVADNRSRIASENFTVEVTMPAEIVSASLAEKQKILSNFSIATAALWYAEKIKENLGIQKMQADLSSFAEKISQNASEAELASIKQKLDAMVSPVSIYDSFSFAESFYYVQTEKINLDLLKKAGAGNYEKKVEGETKNAVAVWQGQNLEIKTISLTKAALLENEEKKDIISIIKIKAMPNQTLQKVFLIISLPSGISYEDISFKTPEGQKKIDNSIAYEMSLLKEKELELAMPGKISPLDLNIFASPEFSKLEIVLPTTCGNKICETGEDYKNCPEDCKPTRIFIAIIAAILLFAGVAAYLIWAVYAAYYKKSMVKRLFKSQKEYDDLLIFIAHNMSRGMNAEQIEEKLFTAGWNKAQVDYTMKEMEE